MTQKLNEGAKKNKLHYIKDYNKKNYKSFNFTLSHSEIEHIKTLCDTLGIKKVDILRKGIEHYDAIIKK